MTRDPAPLIAAAHQRSHDTHQRTVTTLRRLDAAGTPITFAAVAQAAGVSRSWLYRQPDLRHEIDQLRDRHGPITIPSTQQASTESLRRRLEADRDEIRRLKQENEQLRREVARRFGQQRADGLT